MGGSRAAIERGYLQGEIQAAAYEFQKSIENKEQVVVGVNAFQMEENLSLERLKVDPAIEQAQCAGLVELRSKRDNQSAAELMGRLDTASRGSENLMPLLIECVEHDLTLGEICGVLRKTWGEYQPPSWL